MIKLFLSRSTLARVTRHGGFTIIELMVTIAVAAILIMVAIPNFSETIKNNRLITRTNDLVTSINIARQTAISRSLVTMVCHTDNAESGSPSCNPGSNSSWSAGSLVYVAPPRTLVTTERAYNSSSDELIQAAFYSTTDKVTVTEAGGANYVSFGANGLLFSFTELEFKVCDDRTGETGRIVTVSRAGRISTTEATGGKACA